MGAPPIFKPWGRPADFRSLLYNPQSAIRNLSCQCWNNPIGSDLRGGYYATCWDTRRDGLVVSWEGLVIGALFGFIGSLIVQMLLARDRRAKLARVSRDVIVVETAFNLRALDFLANAASEMLGSTGPWVGRSTSRTRSRVYQRMLDPDIIAVLTASESSKVVELIYQLEEAETAYEELVQAHVGFIEHPDHGRVAIDAAFVHWLRTLTTCALNLMNLLMVAVHCQEASQLSGIAASLEKATRDLRKIWRRVGEGKAVEDRVMVCGWTTELREFAEPSSLQSWSLVLCWNHDWPECPVPVRALKDVAFPPPS